MPFTLRVCSLGLMIVGIAIVASHAADGDVAAGQDSGSQDQSLDQELQLPTLQFPLQTTPPRDGEWAVQRSFDFNGDGQINLTVEWTTGRGPLSTYYSAFRLVAHGNTKILKSGQPQPPGAELSLLDLTNAVTEAPLCSVGASLRYPERPASDFSSGPWLGKENQALAIAILLDGHVQLGYVNLTVTERGEVTLNSKNFVTLTPAKVIVEPGR